MFIVSTNIISVPSFVSSYGALYMRNTSNGFSNWSGYPNDTDYSNYEMIHTLVILARTSRTINLTGFTNDMDFFVASACDNSTGINRGGGVSDQGGDETVTFTNSTGNTATYYIIVEGYLGAVGSVTLTCN